MRSPLNSICIRAVTAIALCCLLLPGATGNELPELRQKYVQAQKALQSGRLTEFRALAAELRAYPLYPYLVYDYIRPRLKTLKEEEIAGSLELHGDVPGANDVRAAWLRILAQRGDYAAFLRNYTTQTDISLRCLQLLARIKTGRDEFLLEDARSLWLHPKSQPPECNAVFERLYRSDLVTAELVWARIRLSMAEGETGLASWLGRRLPASDRQWLERWLAMHANPHRGLSQPADGDSDIARTIVLYGMQRLSRTDVNRAIERWPALRNAYGFSREQVAELDRTLALAAARNRHPRALALLDAVDNNLVNEEVFDWRVRTALQDYDWNALLKWTEGAPPSDEAARQSFQYWRARALEQSGQAAKAAELYGVVAATRDYYGFMAADRIQTPYDLNHHPLPHDQETQERLTTIPAITRAHELFALGSRWQATREWQQALQNLTTYEMQIAALLAADWGWHDRAIATLGQAQAYDDLVLRFPVAWEEELRAYAERRNLDPSWVFAVVRQESAFREDAKSPAGALGLMQVMPATGRETAGRIGIKYFKTSELLHADSNIPIGTAYLKFMLEHFGGNMILATAAYNAGPGNVTRWLPPQPCMESDVWIERIPITETRKYVQRVLYFASIYDWRLRADVKPMNQRMAGISASPRERVAGYECRAREPGEVVSMVNHEN